MQKPVGYRPEMLGLKVADCDFQRKLIHVRRSVESRTRKLQPTKSQASTAAVPMPDELGKHLQIFLQHQWREDPSGFLFLNRNGNNHAIGKVVQHGLWPAQDACGIPRSGVHAFRHQIASELLEGGAALGVVQKQLRHSDASRSHILISPAVSMGRRNTSSKSTCRSL